MTSKQSALHLLLFCVGVAISGQAQETTPHYHWPARSPFAYSRSGGGLPNFDVTFHGGPVQTTTASYAIYWKPKGSSMNKTYQKIINQFLTDVGGSPLYGYATEYSGSNGRVQNISTFGGSYVDTTPFPKGGITDKAVQDAVSRAITANGWQPSITTSFFVMLGSGPQFGFCAYHSAFQINNQPAVYSLIPYFDQKNAGGCGAPFGISPNNNFAADTAIGNLTHEQMESVTDPLGNAWYDQTNGEVGDICIYSYGVPFTRSGGNISMHGHSYIVQEEWSQKHKSCQPNL